MTALEGMRVFLGMMFVIGIMIILIVLWGRR